MSFSGALGTCRWRGESSSQNIFDQSESHLATGSDAVHVGPKQPVEGGQESCERQLEIVHIDFVEMPLLSAKGPPVRLPSSVASSLPTDMTALRLIMLMGQSQNTSSRDGTRSPAPWHYRPCVTACRRRAAVHLCIRYGMASLHQRDTSLSVQNRIQPRGQRSQQRRCLRAMPCQRFLQWHRHALKCTQRRICGDTRCIARPACALALLNNLPTITNASGGSRVAKPKPEPDPSCDLVPLWSIRLPAGGEPAVYPVPCMQTPRGGAERCRRWRHFSGPDSALRVPSGSPSPPTGTRRHSAAPMVHTHQRSRRWLCLSPQPPSPTCRCRRLPCSGLG